MVDQSVGTLSWSIVPIQNRRSEVLKRALSARFGEPYQDPSAEFVAATKASLPPWASTDSLDTVAEAINWGCKSGDALIFCELSDRVSNVYIVLSTESYRELDPRLSSLLSTLQGVFDSAHMTGVRRILMPVPPVIRRRLLGTKTRWPAQIKEHPIEMSRAHVKPSPLVTVNTAAIGALVASGGTVTYQWLESQRKEVPDLELLIAAAISVALAVLISVWRRFKGGSLSWELPRRFRN